jgi:hypothetical protein
VSSSSSIIANVSNSSYHGLHVNEVLLSRQQGSKKWLILTKRV